MIDNSHVHPFFRPILANFTAGMDAAEQRRTDRLRRIAAIDLGEARKFTQKEDDVHEAISHLVVCRKCGCIGDRENARDMGLNQADGVREWECLRCRGEENQP